MNKTTRVFCTRPSGIVLRKLVENLQEKQVEVRMVDASLELDLEAPMWEKTELVCGDGSQPFTIEHYLVGMQGSKVENEAKRLLTMVEETSESWGKREVTVYLKMTRELFVLRTKGEVGRQTSRALDNCVDMFATLGEGVVLVDGEGFHKKGELILPFTKF